MTVTDDTARLDLPESPRIPGLRFRRFTGDPDFPALAELMTTANLADGIEEVPDAAILRAEYERHEGFDPHADTIFAEVNGSLVGYGEVSRTIRASRSVYSTSGTVLPDWRRRGIGRAILRRNEGRLREMATGHADPGGRVLSAWIHDTQGGTGQLLEAEGYEPVRYGFAMWRPNLDELPQAALPEGLEIRPVRPEDHRAIYDADTEAFLDHWEYLDTSLWQVAWDGDQVAGSVMPTIWKPENERLGVRRAWLDHISVRRPWRRRGLARALIVSALEGLRAGGIEEAMLGVDGENPTGALALYESLGFAVKARASTWRKAW
jgi:mycothiol synthase